MRLIPALGLSVLIPIVVACSGGGSEPGTGSGGLGTEDRAGDGTASGGSAAGSGSASSDGGSPAGTGASSSVGGSGGGEPAAPPDCSGITAAGFELCESGADFCGAVFTDSSGCTEVCAAAGLGCETAYENLDASCGADMTLAALACDSGHQSDYCRCSGPVGDVGAGGSGGTSAGGGGTSGGGTSGGGSGGTSGGGGSGGTGGSGGNPALWQVTGFASVAGQGLTTTTGGGNLTPTDVTTCDALATALSGDTARVIRIPEGTTLDCRTSGNTVNACRLQCSAAAATPVFYRVPVTGQDCTTLADFNGDGTLEVPAGTLQARPETVRDMSIGSNKTLYGAGDGATILGVSFNISNKSNIIVRNLRIGEVNPALIEAGDGLTVNTSHHVWIDHCEFFMISDGYVDVRYTSRNVTFSYNHIVGQNSNICGGKHNFVSLVDEAEVTMHHNYFDKPGGRNPKVGGASKAHLYNNFYDGVSYFCANSGTGAEVLVQNNSYKDSSRPHWKDGGKIEASGNVYTGTTSATYRDGGDDVFTPPYSFTLDAASGLATSVPANAGPGIGL